MWALARKTTQWMENLYFIIKLMRPKLSKSVAQVTPTMGILHISAHMLDPVQKLQSVWKWDKGIDIYPKDKTSYTTWPQEALLK